MEFKKLLAGFLSATIITFSAGPVYAIYGEELVSPEEIVEIVPISAELEDEVQIQYRSFTGIVKEIKDYQTIEGAKFISVENENGEPANIIITDDTYILDNAEIEIGATITAYYDATKPMIMIYPPQYSAEVIVVEREDRHVKFDVFDENLVSKDKALKLTISDETEIYLQDGTAYEGELANRKLIVVYSIIRESFPAQTTPEKIIVMAEKAEDLPALEVSQMQIVVNGKVIEAPAAYTNEQGTVMVPLRAIAEALGYTVTWHNETRSVTLGEDIALTIGEDLYIKGESSISLGTAPEIKGDRTFVPLSFFKEVLQMNNAYVFEGQIVIDNGEIMK